MNTQPNKVTYKELIRDITNRTGFYQFQVRLVLEALGESVNEHLHRGKAVYLQPLGRFYVEYRKGHKHSHPQTGKMVWIPERMIPKYNWGKRVYRTIRDHQ